MNQYISRWKTAAILGTGLAVFAPQALAAATWKATIWGQSRSSTLPFETYAKEVAAKTGGQLKIEFNYDKVKAPESADLLKSGGADAAYFCSSYFGEKMPLTTVLDLPMFAPDSIPAMGKVGLALADHAAIQEELKKWNAKMMIPVPLSQYQLMGTRPIAKIADFKGAKVRISPEMGKIFEEYGASTLMTSGNETLAALKSGAIDTASLPYPYGYAVFKVHEGSKYVTEKISLGSQLCYFAVNQKSFDALPAAQQKVLLDQRKPTVDMYEKIYAQEDAANIDLFKKKGIEFVTFNPADRARLVAKSIKYWQTWVEEREKKGLKGREVFEFTQAQIRQATSK